MSANKKIKIKQKTKVQARQKHEKKIIKNKLLCSIEM